MFTFGWLRVVRTAQLREIVLAQVVALIETSATGVRVDMNSTAQQASPNTPHALSHQLMKLIDTPAGSISPILRSLELDEQSTRRQREALYIALGVFGSRARTRTLYQVIREAIDRDQLYIRSTTEQGHAVRVVTYWQDQAERRAQGTTATD